MVVARFGEQREPYEGLLFDRSGLLLLAVTHMAHSIAIYRCGHERDAAGGASRYAQTGVGVASGRESETNGPVAFVLTFTLARGITPAIVTDVAVSPDSRLVAVSSAKGTTHIYALPALSLAGSRAVLVQSNLCPARLIRGTDVDAIEDTVSAAVAPAARPKVAG